MFLMAKKFLERFRDNVELKLEKLMWEWMKWMELLFLIFKKMLLPGFEPLTSAARVEQAQEPGHDVKQLV